MKKHLSKIVLAVALLVGAFWAPTTQAAITSTTAAAAIGASDTTIQVASATGIAANTTVLVVEQEMMSVVSITGTVVRVTRGAFGSKAAAHTSGSTVFIGKPTDFPSNTWGSPIASTSYVINCMTGGATCSPTNVSSTVRVIYGTTGALNGASPSVAAVVLSPVFSSSTSYTCVFTPKGNTAAIAAGGVAVAYTSASTVTVTAANGATHTLSYVCYGT